MKIVTFFLTIVRSTEGNYIIYWRLMACDQTVSTADGLDKFILMCQRNNNFLIIFMVNLIYRLVREKSDHCAHNEAI